MKEPTRPNETIEEFWDNNHKTNSHFYLSGTDGSSQVSILRLHGIVQPNTRLLNIGIGKGYCTKHWVEHGCLVSVLDISEVAIQRVRNIIEAAYTDSNIEDLPTNYFDYITCLLVVQHMNTETLDRHLKYVINSLKPNGVYAVQFAYALYGKPNKDDLETCQIGESTRTLEEMTYLVEKHGGKILSIFDGGQYPSFEMGWHILHISKEV